MAYNDGSFYQGFWKNDKRHGAGRLVDKNGKTIYSGRWVDDKFISKEKPDCFERK